MRRAVFAAVVAAAIAVGVGAVAGPFDVPRASGGTASGLTLASSSITAATGGLAGATQITTALSLVTVNTSAHAVKLPPTPAVGDVMYVVNVTADTTKRFIIYPGEAGDQIDNLGAGVGYEAYTGVCVATSAAQWRCMPQQIVTTAVGGPTILGGYYGAFVDGGQGGSGFAMKIGNADLQLGYSADLDMTGWAETRKILVRDNQTPAVVFAESTNNYLAIHTTNSAEHLVVHKPASFASTTAIAAFATGGQASATVICDDEDFADVTTVGTAGDSVKFPTPSEAGKRCFVSNRGANAMDLFPASGGTLCIAGSACAAADAALSVAANALYECFAISTTVWRCK